MFAKTWIAASMIIMTMILVPSGWAADAEDAFQAGQRMLAAGDLPAAMKQFAAAARADMNNQEYLQKYAVVRQAIMIQDALKQNMDDTRWETLARALHTFYIDNKLYDSALDLDQRIHTRINTAYTALMLAETQLAMNKDAEAAKVLAALDEAKQTPASRAVRGLALARMGQLDDAKQVGPTIQLTDDAGPATVYAVARYEASTGNSQQACSLLSRCFENVAPSVLDGFKQHAKACPEFVSLVSTPGFTEALQTESKVPESKCSGGTACSNCPMRGSCSSQ